VRTPEEIAEEVCQGWSIDDNHYVGARNDFRSTCSESARIAQRELAQEVKRVRDARKCAHSLLVSPHAKRPVVFAAVDRMDAAERELDALLAELTKPEDSPCQPPGAGGK
jgi:hypothetical protein